MKFKVPFFCIGIFLSFQIYSQKNFHTNNVLNCEHLPADFSIDFNACNQHQVNFTNNSLAAKTVLWSFGDGTTSNSNSAKHVYTAEGIYTVSLVVKNRTGCLDTVSKQMGLVIQRNNIFLSKELNICKNDTLHLQGDSTAIAHCWSPVTYLDSFNIYDPLVKPAASINYQYNIVARSSNLIPNHTFNRGDSDFNSDYIYDSVVNTSGHYYVGNNPQKWNSLYQNCLADSSFIDTMLVVNGSTIPNAAIWIKHISVVPNTNYQFSFFLQTITTTDSVVLQVSINNGQTISQFNVPSLPCIRKNLSTNWFSSSDTEVIIKIIDLNTKNYLNAFGLDNMSLKGIYLKTDSIKIHVPDPATINITKDTFVCKGSSVQLKANSASAVSYQWFPSNTLNNANTNSPVALPLYNTVYNVIVTDTNSCKNLDSVKVQVLPDPAISKSSDTTICKGIKVSLFASGGINYLWNPGAGLSNPNISNPVAAPANSTKYYVTVTGANGCKSNDSVLIAVRPDPVFKVDPSTVNLCLGDSVTLTASGGDKFLWTPSNTLSNATAAMVSAFPSTYTNYKVTITETTCNNIDSVFAKVYVNLKPTTKVSKTNDVNCILGESKLNASGGVNYKWSPVTGLSDINIANPVASPAQTTIYYVKVTNENGCSKDDSIEVKVLQGDAEKGYLIPTAFTPNNDGLNDCFGIKYWGNVTNLQFSIYNRWGKRIFYTTDVSKCWDGTFNGAKQPIGTFIYEIKAGTICGFVQRKGTFILIR